MAILVKTDARLNLERITSSHREQKHTNDKRKISILRKFPTYLTTNTKFVFRENNFRVKLSYSNKSEFSSKFYGKSELEQSSTGDESNVQTDFDSNPLESSHGSRVSLAVGGLLREDDRTKNTVKGSRVNGCQEFHGGNVVSAAAIPRSPAISRASVHPSRSITDKARLGTFRSVAASKICVRRRGMKRCIFRPRGRES